MHDSQVAGLRSENALLIRCLTYRVGGDENPTTSALPVPDQDVLGMTLPPG